MRPIIHYHSLCRLHLDRIDALVRDMAQLSSRLLGRSVPPGNHTSGGRRKSGKTRKGNRRLRDALGISALSATRAKGTYLAA